MLFNPHDYQRTAIRFIEDHPVAAVFLDMGLGKTVITLTAIQNLMYDRFEVQKVLVVAPLRVARDTWGHEAALWEHLRGLRVSIAVGDVKARTEALRARADVYVINRENVQWLVESHVVPLDWDMVVIDELSSFKSGKTKRFKAMKAIRANAKRCVGLTGTPSPNGYSDLWAEFNILDLGQRLGKYITRYFYEYFTPGQRCGPVVYNYTLRKGADKLINDKISDITISMTARDNLKMPELVSSQYRVHLDERERKVYDSMKKDMVLELPEGDLIAPTAAALSNTLTQMANGATYIHTEDGQSVKFIHDRKLDALEDIIEAANGQPVLVAYWYKHDLARIKERLEHIGVNSRVLDDHASMVQWNEGKIQVALMHPASAGHGLNLQRGGHHLVWFGLPWSLELYQQTNARLWRQGQTSETVIIQHIVTEGTIDERILKALDKKDMQQATLIEAVKAELKEV